MILKSDSVEYKVYSENGMLCIELLLPKPKIDRSKTYIVWNNRGHKPGKYSVKKGTVARVMVDVINEGKCGKVKVILYDAYNKKILWDKETYMKYGERKSFDDVIQLNQNMVLQVYTYYFNGQKWVQYDEYG